MDGSPEDLAAEAHSGRDHPKTIRAAPRGPGHADTHEAPAGRHHAVSPGRQRKPRGRERGAYGRAA